MKSSTGLAKHCEMALSEAWYYLWGAYAQLSTQSVINNNIKQYPSNEKWRSYVSKSIGKTRVCDCYGLVKSYLWWTDNKSNPKYNGAYDVNTTMAYNRSKEKGLIATLPEIPGIILYMPGHVGVYISNGRFIECMGGGVGMYEGRITNGKITKGSKFTHWFKDVNIDYTCNANDGNEKKEDDVEMISEMRVSVNGGTPVTVPSILKDGLNYPNLRELAKILNVSVGYDATSKVVKLNK